MKPLLLFLFFVVVALAAITAEKPAASAFVKPSVATNGMWIWADRGLIYDGVNSSITWSNNVRVTDPQMFLQCDLLTAFRNTNTSTLEVIVAEGSVMLIADGRQLLGDRAVYTASNDTVIVTGKMAALIDSRATLIGTQFVFDRRSGTAYSVEPVTTLLETEGGFTPPEALKRASGSQRAPASTNKITPPGKN